MWTWQERKGSPEIKMYTFNLLPVSTITELFWLTFNQSCSLESMESQNFLHFVTGNCFVIEIEDIPDKNYNSNIAFCTSRICSYSRCQELCGNMTNTNKMYTVTRSKTTFWSSMDRIYKGGPTRL